MTARNKPPAHRIYNRSGSPLLLHLPVQAGATQAIKKGEICKLRDPSDLSTYPIIPATTDDTGFVPLIANEEQKATDAARVMQFILPTTDVAFEFALNTATAVKMGDKIAIHDSQTVKVASSNAVGAAVAAPLADSTWQSVSACFVVFGLARAEAVKYFPFAGSAVAGAVDGLADMDDVGSISYTDTAILVADGDSYEEVTLSGAITMTNAGVVTLAAVSKTKNIPLTEFLKDNLVTELGTAGDATNLGLVAGTHGSASPTLQGSDVGGSSGSETARLLLSVPDDYTSGDLTLRFHAGMLTTVSDTTATLDVQAYESDGEAGVGDDLCETDAVSINSLTLADKDFTIDGDGLAAGDILDVEITVAVQDSGNAGVMIPVIGAAKLLYTGKP